MRLVRGAPFLTSMFLAASSRAWAPRSLHRQASAASRWMHCRGGSSHTNGDSTSATHRSLHALHASSSALSSNIMEPEQIAGLTKQHFPVREFGGLVYQETSPNFFKVIFILGGPGAGKGTQSALMEQHFPVVHLSVGELLRQEQTKPDTPFKQILEDALTNGKIVPVEVSLGLLQQAMKEKAQAMGPDIIFLVDGFPRNFDNLKGYIKVMQDVAVLWSLLVYSCPLPVLEKRILERGKDSGRADDNLASVKKRFTTFETETMPVINALKQISKENACPWTVVDICGDCPLDDVWIASQQALNQLILHDVLTANAALLRAAQSGDAEGYQALCDPEWFANKSVMEVMREQEGESEPIGEIIKTQLDMITGRQVAVGYERVMQGQRLREKRIWSHQGVRGWRNIHFSRIPMT